ncbi:pyruvate formate lyase family protein [Megamonas rupellensis]|uniref:pyruvate formate lyase family protein n=1 Tax=Megamonas rupellensis TaxID=491921 RepID=UPI00241F296D|nr:pyruvate formate lyase family protein [Megamonas rupellensis]
MNKDILLKIKSLLKKTKFYQNRIANKYYLKTNNRYTKIDKSKKFICYYKKNKVNQYLDLFSKINIELDSNSRFQMWLNLECYFVNLNTLTDNMSVDYSIILSNSINNLIKKYECKNNSIGQEYCKLLKGINLYLDRIINKIEIELKYSKKNEFYLCKSLEIFRNMKDKKAETVEDVFQRIIFWSSIFWQSQHRLMGLGRMDKLLNNIEFKGSNEELKSLIKDFYITMHKYYLFKSNNLIGDTGQIIILGGLENNNSYFCNKYTYAFIEALKEQPLPDPKILLRVAKSMPDDLLELALKCIATGVGSPLLSNDEIVVESLKELTEDENDAFNYVTSACWEPLIYGKSMDKNNLSCINYAQPIIDMYKDKEFFKCTRFEEVLNLYLKYLNIQLDDIKNHLDKIKWEKDPLVSMFFSSCIDNDKDISEGGGAYNNYGILSVGLANAIDSLCIIRDLLSLGIEYQLEDLISNKNIANKEIEKIKRNKYFAKDDDNIVKLVKEILDFTNLNLKNYCNKFGGKIKWGLSSPGYIDIGKITEATFDGRDEGEPLSVHISSIDSIPYTEIINFSSKIYYKGIRSNGNVVDLFISPNWINNNFEKFFLFIKTSINVGFFQMQMNVVSSKQLIEAQLNPLKYPNLIVRVWGFSALFNDLPKEYQDLLIKRAKICEGLNV